MSRVNGVYRHDFPDGFFDQIPGISMKLLPDDYKNQPADSSVEILIVRQGLVKRELLDKYPNVRWLQLLNSGYEQVDLSLLKERNIEFTNARSVFGKTIAEDVMAKLLFLARDYPLHFNNQKRHLWAEATGNMDLWSKTIGILGAGNIGKEVALRARAFGMDVIAYDPYGTVNSCFSRVYKDQTGLYCLLEKSDFVVLCLPVTEETRDIICEETLSRMKAEAFLINVARGEIVNEADLVSALQKRQISGAFLDVTRQEPLAENSLLWDVENMYITPHQAAYGDLLQPRIMDMVKENLIRYLKGESLLNRVDVK